jgi:uncharacterized protein YjbI with pentapeptide repeats
MSNPEIRNRFTEKVIIKAGRKYNSIKKAIEINKANLWGADLWGADLRGADLREADLRGANSDFSSFPLWCGSFNMKVDDRLIWQLICHITRLDISGCGKEAQKAVFSLSRWRNKFCKYRGDVGKIKPIKQD